ncbi:hypothetical protein N7540_000808 [Penicillium herquei]|nr:hypothetical protein N7540_000808 [Penicillium herquei]
MSAPTGIPTYTSAPLNPNQKEENTTAAEPERQPATAIETSTTTASQPPNAAATSTAPSYSPVYATASNPPSAEPAAAASLPAPTAAPFSQASGNLTATSTTAFPSSTSQSPPAPQPGSIPTPPVAGYTPTAPSPIPPPPKVGEAVSPFTQSTAPPTQTPYAQSYAYQRPSVSHTAVPNSTSSPYASVYRTSSDAGSSRPQGLPLHYGGGGGGADNIFPEDEEPGFLSSAKGWMQSAGTKLAEVEAEVWKRINDVHGK